MKLPLILSTLFISTHAFSATETSKIYYSFDSEREATLFVVPSKKQDTYYLNYQGFEHHFDGETLLYKKAKNDIGKGYHFKLVGMPNVNFRNDGDQTIISGTVVSYSNVYLDDDTVTKVIYQGTTDRAKDRRIIEQYKKRQFETFSKIEAKKMYKKHLESLVLNCNSSIDVDIDWNLFEKMKIKTAPSKLSAYLQSLEAICAIDEDYAEAVKNIKTIKVMPSDTPETHSAKLSSSKLTIRLGNKVENLPETSHKLIYDIF